MKCESTEIQKINLKTSSIKTALSFMKQGSETNKHRNIKKTRRNNIMPHINSQENMMNSIEDSYDNEEYLDERNSQEMVYDSSHQPTYKYTFPYEDQQQIQTLYVNAKQLMCIKKRKMRREYLDSLMVAQKNSYLHESRHRHAMKRLRAPSGRFLTKEETEEYYKKMDHSNDRND